MSGRAPVEGLIAAEFNRKVGYVDLKGEVAIQPRFENAQAFSEGLAAVKVDGKWGYVDVLGNAVIQPQFADARRFAGGRLSKESRVAERDGTMSTGRGRFFAGTPSASPWIFRKAWPLSFRDSIVGATWMIPASWS